MKKKIILIFVLLVGILLGYLTHSFFLNKSLNGMSLTYFNMGQEYFQKKDYPKAIAYFNGAVGVDPKSFLARISLPEAYAAMGNYDLAFEEYEATLKVAKEEGWKEPELKWIERKIEDIKRQSAK